MDVNCCKLDCLFQIKMFKILKKYHTQMEHQSADFRFCEDCKPLNDKLLKDFINQNYS